MKVLQLTCHFRPNIGGVETHLVDLVTALVKRNHQVYVLTYQPLTTKSSWSIFEKKKNLSIYRIPWLAGLFYKLVKNPILEFIYLFPGIFLTLPVVLLTKKPDVIHSHGLVAACAGVFWGKIFGRRTIATTHSIYNFPQSGLYTSFVKLVFGGVDAVLTLSKQSRKEIEKLGISKSKIKVFTYWIDLNNFKPIKNAKEKVGWKNKFVVLFVGRLIEEKGIKVLLDSVKSWNKNIHLAIAGSGPLGNEIQNSKFKIHKFYFLGKLNQRDLPKYYSAADVLIVPSTHEEGFGRVILESLACGTPVIGSNRGAIPEAMDDSVGRLIDVSSDSIKNVLEHYYVNKNELKKLSQNARKFAEKNYSEENVDIIINSYNK